MTRRNGVLGDPAPRARGAGRHRGEAAPADGHRGRVAHAQRAADRRNGADGHSNREIAQTLILTVKRVETHLSNPYCNLDIRSRSELARALGGVA